MLGVLLRGRPVGGVAVVRRQGVGRRDALEARRIIAVFPHAARVILPLVLVCVVVALVDVVVLHDADGRVQVERLVAGRGVGIDQHLIGEDRVDNQCDQEDPDGPDAREAG